MKMKMCAIPYIWIKDLIFFGCPKIDCTALFRDKAMIAKIYFLPMFFFFPKRLSYGAGMMFL